MGLSTHRLLARLSFTPLLALVCLGPMHLAIAQSEYPSKPITVITPNTPAEFAAFMRAEYKLWGDLIRDNNIKAE